MSYSTNADVIAYMSSAVLAQLHGAGSPDATIIKDHRAQAAAAIDSYISAQTATPAVTAFDNTLAERLKKAELSIVKYLEHGREDVESVPALVREEYDETIEWLEKVSNWEVSLPCSDDPHGCSVEMRRGDDASKIARQVIEYNFDDTDADCELGDTGDRNGCLMRRGGTVTRITYQASAQSGADELLIGLLVNGEAVADSQLAYEAGINRGTLELSESFSEGDLLAVSLTGFETELPDGVFGKVWLEVEFDAETA